MQVTASAKHIGLQHEELLCKTWWGKWLTTVCCSYAYLKFIWKYIEVWSQLLNKYYHYNITTCIYNVYLLPAVFGKINSIALGNSLRRINADNEYLFPPTIFEIGVNEAWTCLSPKFRRPHSKEVSDAIHIDYFGKIDSPIDNSAGMTYLNRKYSRPKLGAPALNLLMMRNRVKPAPYSMVPIKHETPTNDKSLSQEQYKIFVLNNPVYDLMVTWYEFWQLSDPFISRSKIRR